MPVHFASADNAAAQPPIAPPSEDSEQTPSAGAHPDLDPGTPATPTDAGADLFKWNSASGVPEQTVRKAQRDPRAPDVTQRLSAAAFLENDTPPRRTPLNTGARKQLPSERLVIIMNELLGILQREYHAVYNHNLGVQSGTAVIEDLLVRRVYALCQKVQRLITTHDTSAEALVTLCAALEGRQLNQLQTVFDSFDMHEVTDFLRVRIYNTSNLFAKSPVAAESGDALLRRLQLLKVTHPQFKTQSSASKELTTHMSLKLSTSQTLDKTMREKVMFNLEAAQVNHLLRFQEMRDAGHPFVTVVDHLVLRKRAKAAREAALQAQNKLVSLLDIGKGEKLAVELHHMLKCYPNIRSAWLKGSSLETVLRLTKRGPAYDDVDTSHGRITSSMYPAPSGERTLAEVDKICTPDPKAAVLRKIKENKLQTQEAAKHYHPAWDKRGPLRQQFQQWGGKSDMSHRDRALRVEDSIMDTCP